MCNQNRTSSGRGDARVYTAMQRINCAQHKQDAGSRSNSLAVPLLQRAAAGGGPQTPAASVGGIQAGRAVVVAVGRAGAKRGGGGGRLELGAASRLQACIASVGGGSEGWAGSAGRQRSASCAERRGIAQACLSAQLQPTPRAPGGPSSSLSSSSWKEARGGVPPGPPMGSSPVRTSKT